MRVYDFLCNNQDNKLYTSDSTKGGVGYTGYKQLKEIFDKLGVDLNNLNTLSIQVIEKRFRNYNDFMQLLDNGSLDELRNSERMDTY